MRINVLYYDGIKDCRATVYADSIKVILAKELTGVEMERMEKYITTAAKMVHAQANGTTYKMDVTIEKIRQFEYPNLRFRTRSKSDYIWLKSYQIEH